MQLPFLTVQLPFLKVRLAEISFTRSSEPFLTLRLKGTFLLTVRLPFTSLLPVQPHLIMYESIEKVHKSPGRVL